MRNRNIAVLVLLVVLLSLVGCGGGGDGGDGGGGIPMASVSQTVGSEGRTIEIVGNKGEVLTMEIPEEALETDTNISIILVDDSNVIPSADSLFPKVVLGPEGTIFEKPIYLTFQITDEILQAAGVASLDEAIGYLNIYYWNGDSQTWEPLTIFEVDSENNTVVAEITHFSVYQLVLDWYHISRVEILTPIRKGKEFRIKVTGDSRSFSWADYINAALIARFPSFMEEKLAQMIFRPDSETSQDFVFTAPNEENTGNLVISDSNGKILWEQEIVVDYETDVFRNDGYYLDLIDQYSPVLVFGQDERDPWKTRFPDGREVYFPTRIEDALEDAKLNTGRFSKIVVDNPSINDLSGLGDSTFILSFDGESKSEADREKLIYATAIDTNDYVFLQYWFYYFYDPKDGSIHQCIVNCDFNLDLLGFLKCQYGCFKGDQPSLQSLTSHHGDFESITVMIRKGDNHKLKEEWVIYGQHLSDQRMKHMDKGIEWTKAGVKVPWNNAKKEGTHPYVYIALGSHGCYPREALYGVYTKRKIGDREFEFEYIEKAGGGIKWLPDDYAIEYLPRLSYLYPDSPQWESLKFLLFSGYWGNNYLVTPRLMTHDNKWINLVQWINELQEKTFGEIPEPKPEPPVNSLPVATINSPLADSNFVEGDEISFSGTGTDAEDDDLSGDSLVWTSDKDGEIGKGGSFNANDLSVGVHTITLTATDSESAADSDSVVITITEASEPEPPAPTKPLLPTLRSWFGLSVLGDEIYLIGGGSCNEPSCHWFGQYEVDIVETYNVSSGIWTTKASLIRPRFALSSIAVNNKIYVFGGTAYCCSQPIAEVEEYDPVADIWSLKANIPTWRWKATSAVVDGKIYVFGGGPTGNQNIATDIVEAYDISNNSWIAKNPMPTQRYGAASVVINGKIYVFGGHLFDNMDLTYKPKAVLEVYDPINDTWVVKTPMAIPRGELAAVTINGKIYAIGGIGYECGIFCGDSKEETILRIVEEYDPVSDNWTRKSPMPVARTGLAAAAINGKIYVFGGINEVGIVGIVDIYDSVSDTWLSD